MINRQTFHWPGKNEAGDGSAESSDHQGRDVFPSILKESKTINKALLIFFRKVLDSGFVQEINAVAVPFFNPFSTGTRFHINLASIG